MAPPHGRAASDGSRAANSALAAIRWRLNETSVTRLR